MPSCAAAEAATDIPVTYGNMEIVEGEVISEEEARLPGWKQQTRKKKRDFEENDRAASTMSFGRDPPRRNGNPTGTLKRLTTEARLPKLPADHFRVIVRPRDGIDVKKMDKITFMKATAMATGVSYEQAKHDMLCPNYGQNIYIISTPRLENAKAYVQLKQVQIGGKTYGAAAYLAAQENTCKGVVREVGLMHTDDDLEKMFVNERNPTILDVKRIKNSKTVVLLFSGMKVPRYVLMGNCLVQCSLFRRQHDVCYACGKAGHRADVCINPIGNACKHCGTQNPQEDHQCTPTCSLCGGAHATGEKRCKKRFQVPYIVRQRRRQRSLERRQQRDTRDEVFKGETKQTRDRSETPHSHRRRSSRRSPSASAAAGPGRGRSQSRQGCRTGAPPTRKSRSRSKRSRSSVRWWSPSRGAAAAQGPSRPPAGRTGEARPLKDPARENETKDNRTWADRAADARVDTPPMDREEKQVTHAALPEHVTAEIKGIETMLQTLIRQIEELKQDNKEIRAEIAEIKHKQTEERRDYSKDRKVARRRLNNGDTEEKEEDSFTEILAAISSRLDKIESNIMKQGEEIPALHRRQSAIEGAMANYNLRIREESRHTEHRGITDHTYNGTQN